MSGSRKAKEQITKRLIDALLEGGLVGMTNEFDRLVEQNIVTVIPEEFQLDGGKTYQNNINQIRDTLANDGLAGFVNDSNSQNEFVKETVIPSISEGNVESGGIYAPEHRSIAMDENLIRSNQVAVGHKTRVLEPEINRGPNAAWEGLETISPGQLKL